jgi:hypothetical protein
VAVPSWVSIRRIASSATALGVVLSIASCASSSSPHRAHAATVAASRPRRPSPVGCGFGARPATASQKAGFADARYLWAARRGLPGFQRRAFFRLAGFDLRAGVAADDGPATAADRRAYRTAADEFHLVTLPVYDKGSARKAPAYRAAVAGLNLFFGQARRPTYWSAPSHLDRGCGSGVLPAPGRQQAGYVDARRAWAISYSPVGDGGGAGQAVFWGVAEFDVKVGLEHDRLTSRGRQSYRVAIRVLRNLSSLPDTGVSGHVAAEYKHDLGHLNRFFQTSRYA